MNDLLITMDVSILFNKKSLLKIQIFGDDINIYIFYNLIKIIYRFDHI